MPRFLEPVSRSYEVATRWPSKSSKECWTKLQEQRKQERHSAKQDRLITNKVNKKSHQTWHTDFAQWPSVLWARLQSLVRHIMTVLSSDWLAMKEPIGSQVTPLTKLECPRKTAVQIPLVMFHMWTVLSKLPLANVESSGDQLRSTYFRHKKWKRYLIVKQ